MPASGLRDLVGDASQELTQCRQPFAAAQFDLQPVALSGLTADCPSQPGRQGKRKRNPSQRKRRGQPITLK